MELSEARAIQNYRWKALNPDMKSSHGEIQWQIGRWEDYQAPLVMCDAGFHCSLRIIDAMRYVTPGWIARVDVRGRHLAEADKECWSGMRVIRVWPWTSADSVALAMYAADLVLPMYERYDPQDRRPREAIAAARSYLDGTGAAEAAWAAWAAGAAAEAGWAAVEAAWAAGAAAEAAWAAGAAARAAGAAAEAGWAAGADQIMNQCERLIHQRLQIEPCEAEGAHP